MRTALGATLLAACALALAPAGASAAGTCTASGKSVTPALGDFGTELHITCTDTIASFAVHTPATINGLQWPDARDCHFTDHDFTCTYQPASEVTGTVYTHLRGCDSLTQLGFTAAITFADGSSSGPVAVKGPCSGPPRPKGGHRFTGRTPQTYGAYVKTTANGRRLKEIGFGFHCVHGDRRDRGYIGDNFPLKLGRAKGSAASVFGDDYSDTAFFQKAGAGSDQRFHVHIAGYVLSTKRISLEFRLTRAGCDSGLRRLILHTK
jgi:hypothetical protein